MVYLSDGCIVCKSAVLVGDISIGSGTVVHPFARIIAKTGPVVIGDNNIIEEMAEVVNDGERDKVMILGSGNLIGVAASVSSLKMGNNNTVEARARLGRHTVLPYGCVLTPGEFFNISAKPNQNHCHSNPWAPAGQSQRINTFYV